jgi:hypothetical protein
VLELLEAFYQRAGVDVAELRRAASHQQLGEHRCLVAVHVDGEQAVAELRVLQVDEVAPLDERAEGAGDVVLAELVRLAAGQQQGRQVFLHDTALQAAYRILDGETGQLLALGQGIELVQARPAVELHRLVQQIGCAGCAAPTAPRHGAATRRPGVPDCVLEVLRSLDRVHRDQGVAGAGEGTQVGDDIRLRSASLVEYDGLVAGRPRVSVSTAQIGARSTSRIESAAPAAARRG